MQGVFALLVLFVTASCNQNSSFESDFFSKDSSPAELHELFRACSLNEQYKLYRYGNDVVEPPHIELADLIAERGSTIVPFLANKIANEREEVAVRDILAIFSALQRNGEYDVRSDAYLMALLSKKVTELDEFRFSSSVILEHIKNAPR